MSKRFLLIIAVVILAFAGFVIYNKQKDSKSGTEVQVAGGSNHTQGTGTTGVAIIEFGDFQCPACGAYYPLFQNIKQQYGNKITFQFRHFPLVNSHQNAMAAHRAAEAAGNQNKFWQMHDLLYERQNQWKDSKNAPGVFEDYATELGLNIEQFKSDVTSESVSGIINADVKAAQGLGATSTPTIVIDGKIVENAPQPNDTAAWNKLIDDAIASKGAQ